MYELIELAHDCYYIESPAKIGLIKLSDNDVCIIDSGSDKEAGRKVRKILDEKGWNLKAIYNTHANADHIGGNKYLQNQTRCKIFIPPMNEGFAKFPVLEPAFLYGGYPFSELRNKFLMASESDVETLTTEVVLDKISAIPLSGHFFDMVGFKTESGVNFIADCLFSKHILDKYKIPLVYDVAKYIETLENLKDMNGIFVPAHAEVTDNIIPLAQYNIDKIYEISDVICGICKSPIGGDDILQQVFNNFELKMDFNQYVLVGSTVRSFLSWLKDNGKISAEFSGNKLFWKKMI